MPEQSQRRERNQVRGRGRGWRACGMWCVAEPVGGCVFVMLAKDVYSSSQYGRSSSSSSEASSSVAVADAAGADVDEGCAWGGQHNPGDCAEQDPP